MKQGFTLVELSIVIVILGLLVGGVLAGQALIRSAELRSVTTQIERYSTAITNFKDQFGGLPGDLRNATAYFGAAADCNAQTDTGELTCNGDGNGQVHWGVSTNNRSEFFTVWQHLRVAGLIEGNFNGVKGSGTFAASSEPGVNVPATSIANGCINFGRSDMYAAGTFEESTDSNMFVVGRVFVSGANPDYCHWGIFTPEEAWNIDSKVDDGRPGFGSVKPWNQSRNPNCITTNVAATAEYALTVDRIECNLNFDYK